MKKFFKAFSDFIEQAYAQVLTAYTDQNIQIEPAKEVGDKKPCKHSCKHHAKWWTSANQIRFQMA